MLTLFLYTQYQMNKNFFQSFRKRSWIIREQNAPCENKSIRGKKIFRTSFCTSLFCNSQNFLFYSQNQLISSKTHWCRASVPVVLYHRQVTQRRLHTKCKSCLHAENLHIFLNCLPSHCFGNFCFCSTTLKA